MDCKYYIAFGPNIRNRSMPLELHDICISDNVSINGVEVFNTPFDALVDAYKEAEKKEYFISLYECKGIIADVITKSGSRTFILDPNVIARYLYSMPYGTLGKLIRSQ